MNKIVSDPPYLLRSALSHEGCGYLPIGYLPTGYLPTGYLPIGAAATGGGSLRGKSAAAATLSMATSPAVTIMMIFMMLIPLCCSPGTGRPSDAPIALCLCKAPANFTIPRSGSIAGGMAPGYLSPRPVEWFKCNRLDQAGSGRAYLTSASRQCSLSSSRTQRR